LRTLLAHQHRERLLARCEFFFNLIEKDEENLAALKREIATLGPLPPRIRVHPIAGDFSEVLQAMLDHLASRKSELAPAFIFVDPYGFSIPGALLENLMQAGRVELFVNVMWRYLDMAIANAKATDSAGMASRLDAVFQGPEWRARINSQDLDKRAKQAVELLCEKLHSRWATPIRMLGDNNQTKYLLVHFTNHDSGRELMKDCIWKVCPQGGYFVRGRDDPAQETLITPTPDLAPLRDWVLKLLASKPHRWSELHDSLLSQDWRKPHLRRALGTLRDERKIVGEDYHGRFGPKSNPLIRLR
jgi:three-Cys-motif partner protein